MIYRCGPGMKVSQQVSVVFRPLDLDARQPERPPRTNRFSLCP
jgi:hypothetical protein